MTESIATLIVAGYPDIDAAEADFRALHDAERDAGVDTELVHASVTRLRTPGRAADDRAGADPAATTQAVEGLLTTWVGFDHPAGRVANGLGRDDIRELGVLVDRSPFVLVAVIRGRGASAFVDVLGADDLLVKQRSSDDARFAGLLERYHGLSPN